MSAHLQHRRGSDKKRSNTYDTAWGAQWGREKREQINDWLISPASQLNPPPGPTLFSGAQANRSVMAVCKEIPCRREKESEQKKKQILRIH